MLYYKWRAKKGLPGIALSGFTERVKSLKKARLGESREKDQFQKLLYYNRKIGLAA